MTKVNAKALVTGSAQAAQDRLIEAVSDMSEVMPSLLNDVLYPSANFRGLSITISNRGGYLGIAKIYDGQGIPSICFASGDSPFETLLNLDDRVKGRAWKDDTRAEDYQPKK